MEIQRALELIEKSRHILLLLPQRATLDVLVSAEALSRTLEAQDKFCGFFGVPDIAQKNTGCFFKKLLEPQELRREFIVTLDTNKAPVSELRYEKEEGKVHIIFLPQSHPLAAEHFSFKEGRVWYDLAIALGIKNIEADENTKLDAEFFLRTPLININLEEQSSKYGEVNLVTTGKSSLAEIVYELLIALQEAPLNPELATLLLAGIFSQTKGFRASKVGADTFLISSELLRLGADWKVVQEMGLSDSEEEKSMQEVEAEEKSLSLYQLFGRALVRSRIEEERKVSWSFLTAEDFTKTGRDIEDIHLVMRYLERLLPPVSLRILLAQNIKNQMIGALLFGKEEILESIKSQEAAAFQSPYLKLEREFSAFREAEEYISSLLGDVL